MEQQCIPRSGADHIDDNATDPSFYPIVNAGQVYGLNSILHL